MACEILSERLDGTLLLRLSDPANGNSLTTQACAAAIEALDSAEADADVRCVLVLGEGDQFCAGMTGTPEALDIFVETLRALGKPVVAAVEGQASGAGCALALGCDFIVAAADARFSLFADAAGSSAARHALRALPRALAMRLLCSAQPLTAAEWQAHGLVTEVVESGTTLARSLARATQLAALAPNALARAKLLLS